MLVRLYRNLTHCIEITGCWSEIILIILTRKIMFLEKKFEISFGSNILASFAEFQFQSTDTYSRENFWNSHSRQIFA